MKYLKKFNESLSEILTDDEFWEWDSTHKLEPFTDWEWDKIKSVIQPLLEEGYEYEMEWANNAVTPKTIIDVIEFGEDRVFEIYKAQDEWFVIVDWTQHEDNGRYLKCDQWDGLIETLTNCVNNILSQ